MRKPIVVPDLGWPQLALSAWYVKPGEEVYAGDRVVELLLGGVTFEISAPCSGTMKEHCARLDEHVQPGQVVGYLEAMNPS